MVSSVARMGIAVAAEMVRHLAQNAMHSARLFVGIAGVAAAFLVAGVWRTFLNGVEATDPAALVGASVAFAAVALLACWAPTGRAGTVRPAEALRYE
jgi:hypothetical protein